MKGDVKTTDQLRREIAYFAMRLTQTTSRDRIHRAHIAIRKREKLLQVAMSRETRMSASCAYCGRPAEGNYSIHRDGFGVGPEVDLCDACGSKSTPTCGVIWDRIAYPATDSFAHRRIVPRRKAVS